MAAATEDLEGVESKLLLDEEGGITEQVSSTTVPSPLLELTMLLLPLKNQFETVLREVYLRYATPSIPTSSTTPATKSKEYDVFSNEVTMSRADLDKFASDTNGQVMSDETFSEICDFFDLLPPPTSTSSSSASPESNTLSRLTFKGFLQLYQLQTENDPLETLNDIKKWGYTVDAEGDKLELVTTRKKEEEIDKEEGVRPIMEKLTGLGLGGEVKDEVECEKVEK